MFLQLLYLVMPWTTLLIGMQSLGKAKHSKVLGDHKVKSWGSDSISRTFKVRHK